MKKRITERELYDLAKKIGYDRFIPTKPNDDSNSTPPNPSDPISDIKDSKIGGEPTEDEILAALSPKIGKEEKYTPLDFESPLEMFLFKEIQKNGPRRPHKWQGEVLTFLSSIKEHDFSIASPCRFYLQACNGSGKDAYITSLFSIWLCACKPRSRFICTSSSHTQLELQTESYIRTEAEEWNTVLGKRIFLIKKQHIVCTLTGSEIVLFSTNEPGRAEGWHPFPDCPNSILAICINEAKTVPEDIFKHLKKCTGYTFWLEISSPGGTSGHFYLNCTSARDWNDGYNGERVRKKVSAYECPHISKKEIDDAIEEYGPNDPWVRATYLAEFTGLDEDIVISNFTFDKLIDNPPKLVEECPELPLRIGIDIGVGGDESTLYCFKGNYLWKSKEFRQVDTTLQRDIIEKTLIEWGFSKDSSNIFIDDGNVGHSVADMLMELGWNIQRVVNQSKASNTRRFGNRGAETWWNFRVLVERSILRFDKSIRYSNPKLYRQITSRYYKQRDVQGGLILESKKEARANGHGSPDRADAVVLANCRTRWGDVKEVVGYSTPSKEDEKKASSRISGESLPGLFDDKFVYKHYDNKFGVNSEDGKSKRVFGSLMCMLRK